MSTNPRPESRISELEAQMAIHGARIRELSDDTAEELKVIQRLLKDKTDFEEMNEVLKAVATRDDIAKVETRLDRIEATMATKDDIVELKGDMICMETRIIDTMKQLLQQKSGE